MIKNLAIHSSKNIYPIKKNFHKVILLLKKEFELEIDYLEITVVNSEKIRHLNKEFLKHNFTTDIITFNYSKDNNRLDGEIFISLYDAIDNAKKFKVSVDNEIMRLVVHGVLHLIGHDDTTVAMKKKMKTFEDKLVNEYMIENFTFIEAYDRKNC